MLAKAQRPRFRPMAITVCTGASGVIVTRADDHASARLGALAVAFGLVYFIGTEFMPKLDEGSVLVETRKRPVSR